MVRCTGIRDAPSRPREVQVTRDCREVRKAFPEKTPVFLWVSQATTPYFSQKTQKFYLFVKDPQVKTVHLCCRPPRGGAWIEIAHQPSESPPLSVAPLAGGRGLKYHSTVTFPLSGSRPPRGGAWIEIPDRRPLQRVVPVAPLAGGRGLKFRQGGYFYAKIRVAPLAGGRGLKLSAGGAAEPEHEVAPLAGGRGLKCRPGGGGGHKYGSPPSRGAWIEIAAHTAPRRSRPSPLRPVCPPGAPSCRPAKSSFVPSVVMYPVSFQLFVSPKNSFADFTWPFFSASE